MPAPRERTGAVPAIAALAAFAALMAAAPLCFAAGDRLDFFFALGFAPWTHRRPLEVRPSGLGGIVLAVVLVLAALHLAAARPGGPGAALRLRKPLHGGWRALVALVLVASSVNGALDSLQALIPWWHGSPAGSGNSISLDLLYGVALAPVAEELFFRGALQSAVGLRWGRWTAILVSALAFAAWHEDLPRSNVLFLAGIAYAWITEACGSLLPAVVAHALNNLGAIPFPPVLGLPAPVHLAVVGLSAVALAASVVAASRLSRPNASDGVAG